MHAPNAYRAGDAGPLPAPQFSAIGYLAEGTTLTPAPGYLFCRREPIPERTKAGLALPENARESESFFGPEYDGLNTVLAVGEGSAYKPGDKIFRHPGARLAFLTRAGDPRSNQLNDQLAFLMDERYVIAKVE